MGRLYRQAGLSEPKKIGDGRSLTLSEKDHIERYDLTEDDMKQIREIVSGEMQCCGSTENGYFMKFEFPIFLAKMRD